jgi:bud site selection protein 31
LPSEPQEISRELYDYLLRENYADGALIAKWKKPGFGRLCCVRCVQAGDTNFRTTCVCRVPAKDRGDGETVRCVSCGCRGCAG